MEGLPFCQAFFEKNVLSSRFLEPPPFRLPHRGRPTSLSYPVPLWNPVDCFFDALSLFATGFPCYTAYIGTHIARKE